MHMITMFCPRLFYILVLLLSTIAASAQTGPAGVGTSASNVLWLKADAGTSTTVNNGTVTSWNDQSGNGNAVTQTVTTQQPLYATNVINGFPAVQFDNVSNTNDKLLGADSPTLDNTSGYTFFTVSRPLSLDNVGARVILSKRNTVDVDESFMLFYYTNNKFHTDIQTTNNRFNTATTFSNNTNYLIDVVYDGTLPSASRSKCYVGQALDVTATESSSVVPDNASPLIIGSTDLNDGRPFGGYISEVITYRVALGKAPKIIVDNYLSAKYNIALTANDKYLGDTPANGDYDREVAGIGMDTIQPSGTVSSNTAFATSVAAGLGITSVSGLDVGDYILAGHASPSNYQTTTDIGGITGPSPARWLRIWYVDVTNTGTANTVNINFDMSDGGITPNPLGSLANYVLLYRAGQSGNWTELTAASAISGDQVQFNGYALTLDGYYTIGTKNWPVSPLPIQLLSFTGEAKDQEVELSWQTATEQQNNYFEVQRSADAVDFTSLAKVPTKAPGGNSTSQINYQYNDKQPLSGISYYRLLQTALSGQQKSSGIISVMFEEKHNIAFIVYPNPGKGEFNVDFTGIENNHELRVTMYDMQGSKVYDHSFDTGSLSSNSFKIIPDKAIPNGSYTIYFVMEDVRYAVHVVVE